MPTSKDQIDNIRKMAADLKRKLDPTIEKIRQDTKHIAPNIRANMGFATYADLKVIVDQLFGADGAVSKTEVSACPDVYIVYVKGKGEVCRHTSISELIRLVQAYAASVGK